VCGDSVFSLLKKFGIFKLSRACEFSFKILKFLADVHAKQKTIKGFDSSMVYFTDVGEVCFQGYGYPGILYGQIL